VLSYHLNLINFLLKHKISIVVKAIENEIRHIEKLDDKSIEK